jgi:hypothetical protein
VTRLYDQLAERPRTAINHSSLNPTERAELRRIKVTQSTDITNTGGSDRFTTVYYLDGDEQQAAAVFVAKNEAQLEGIDFGSKNAVQQTVDREVYDWILHALGEHELEKYESVVRETRPDEAVTWMIDSDHYERYPMRRYSIGETPLRADRPPLARCPLRGLRRGDHRIGSRGSQRDRRDVRYILEYYRVADGSTCDPVSHDGEMAVRKRDA